MQPLKQIGLTAELWPIKRPLAKSLIKLRLDKDNASDLALATGVDKDKLASIAAKIASGVALDQAAHRLG